MHVQSNGGWLSGWLGGWLAGWLARAGRLAETPPPPGWRSSINWKVNFLIRIMALFDPDRGSDLPQKSPPPPKDRSRSDPPPRRYLVPTAA